jgi:glycosyltransferase involved in cell wall biosynthesis
MYEITLQQPASLQIFSMHDNLENADGNKYFPSEIFRGFSGKKINFVRAAVSAGLQSDIIIISHVNLLIVGWLVKKIAPHKKVILLAHGIEVWEKLNKQKKRLLGSCDFIFSVSRFTCKKLHELHGFSPGKCKVLNNCLDPYLPLPANNKNEQLLSKYGLNKTNKILFSLTRLSSKDRYKGYDKVMESLKDIKSNYPEVRYFLAGKYDRLEKQHVDSLIRKLDLTENIIMPGFIPDKDLGDYFGIADIYVMPSIKEGFGIVFIEAMYYGVPVIAGNLDGSVDALADGKLGLLINPLDTIDIKNAIEKILANKKQHIANRDILLQKFSYTTYKNNFETMLQ